VAGGPPPAFGRLERHPSATAPMLGRRAACRAGRGNFAPLPRGARLAVKCSVVVGSITQPVCFLGEEDLFVVNDTIEMTFTNYTEMNFANY
jgi:hypothetical protein